MTFSENSAISESEVNVSFKDKKKYQNFQIDDLEQSSKKTFEINVDVDVDFFSISMSMSMSIFFKFQKNNVEKCRFFSNFKQNVEKIDVSFVLTTNILVLPEVN